MSRKTISFIEIALLPHIIDHIMEFNHVSEQDAINQFYHSHTYELLMDEETWVWHYSPLTIYHMFNDEMTLGYINFPEED